MKVDSRLARRFPPTAEGDATALKNFCDCFLHTAKPVREAVVAVLQTELDRSVAESEKREQLDSPNYVAALADLMGYRRGLRTTIDLLTNGVNQA